MGKRLSKDTKKDDFTVNENTVIDDVMNNPIDDDRFIIHGGEVRVIASPSEINKHLKELDKAVSTAQKTFFTIGLNLHWFYTTGAYCEVDGVQYDTIADFAKDRYGIKKASTYQFIQIYSKFGQKDDNDIVIGLKDDYKGYNSTALITMLQMDNETLEKCSPSMKVKEIKQLLKAEKAESAENTESAENEKAVEAESVPSAESSESVNSVVDTVDFSKMLTLYSVSSIEDFENKSNDIINAIKKILANNDGTIINISMSTKC